MPPARLSNHAAPPSRKRKSSFEFESARKVQRTRVQNDFSIIRDGPPSISLGSLNATTGPPVTGGSSNPGNSSSPTSSSVDHISSSSQATEPSSTAGTSFLSDDIAENRASTLAVKQTDNHSQIADRASSKTAMPNVHSTAETIGGRSSVRSRQPTSKAQQLANSGSKFFAHLRRSSDASTHTVHSEDLSEDPTGHSQPQRSPTQENEISFDKQAALPSVEAVPVRSSTRSRKPTAKAVIMKSSGGRRISSPGGLDRNTPSTVGSSTAPPQASLLRHSLGAEVLMSDIGTTSQTLPADLESKNMEPCDLRCLSPSQRLFAVAQFVADSSDDDENGNSCLPTADEIQAAARENSPSAKVLLEFSKLACRCDRQDTDARTTSSRSLEHAHSDRKNLKPPELQTLKPQASRNTDGGHFIEQTSVLPYTQPPSSLPSADARLTDFRIPTADFTHEVGLPSDGYSKAVSSTTATSPQKIQSDQRYSRKLGQSESTPSPQTAENGIRPSTVHFFPSGTTGSTSTGAELAKPNKEYGGKNPDWSPTKRVLRFVEWGPDPKSKACAVTSLQNPEIQELHTQSPHGTQDRIPMQEAPALTLQEMQDKKQARVHRKALNAASWRVKTSTSPIVSKAMGMNYQKHTMSPVASEATEKWPVNDYTGSISRPVSAPGQPDHEWRAWVNPPRFTSWAPVQTLGRGESEHRSKIVTLKVKHLGRLQA